VLAVLGGRAVIAQDTGQAKYNVRVPNGLAFSEFKGYEAWQNNAASDTFTPATTADEPPQANDAKCGLACHTIVKTRDYVFYKALGWRLESDRRSVAGPGPHA
jgi:hypothetical protein